VFERRLGKERYRASTYQIHVMDADGSEPRMLAQDGAEPVWSPDGRKIAFKKEFRGGIGWPAESDIYVMNADGSEQRKLTRGARRESSPVWSPAQR
jgi:TolB protein